MRARARGPRTRHGARGVASAAARPRARRQAEEAAVQGPAAPARSACSGRPRWPGVNRRGYAIQRSRRRGRLRPRMLQEAAGRRPQAWAVSASKDAGRGRRGIDGGRSLGGVEAGAEVVAAAEAGVEEAAESAAADAKIKEAAAIAIACSPKRLRPSCDVANGRVCLCCRCCCCRRRKAVLPTATESQISPRAPTFAHRCRD